MPLYDFECECGEKTEEVFKIIECPDAMTCGKCGGMSEKVLSVGHGGLRTDTPKWLDHHVREALQDSDRVAMGLDKPIETRQEWQKHLDNNNLVCTG
jgi:putative FmdB family regulatory protein